MSYSPPILTIRMRTGIDQYFTYDFTRFFYQGVAFKKNFDSAKPANRDDDVLRWYRFFNNTNEYSDLTKQSYLRDFALFVRHCDYKNLRPESAEAVESLERHLIEQVRIEKMNVNSARKQISCVKKCLEKLGNPSSSWFSSYSLFRSEINPTEGYSDRELSVLIKVIYRFFNQLSTQILDEPDKYLQATTNKRVGTFTYQGFTHDIASPITKCFSAAYFLLAYYTWGNTTVLLNMTKPKEKIYEGGAWYEQSVLKPRANKFVSVSIGDNGTYHVPKIALRFFEQLLKLSTSISTDSHLLYQVNAGTAAPLQQGHIQTFSNWLQQTFSLVADDNKPLRPTASRFRASGSYRYLAKTGNAIETSLLLGNTPRTLNKHYSSGNILENDKQLLAATYTIEGVAKCSDINQAKEHAKKALGIEVLPYEDFLNKYSDSNGQKTVLGTGCKNAFSAHVEKYRRRNHFNPKDFVVDHLACSDIHNCFNCENQVIIESVEDIWCLLSYRESIKDSKVYHLNEQHFSNNYSDLLASINRIVFTVHPKVKRLAEKKLENEGRHPLWPDGINIDF
ncbi:hypothetical protein CGH86_09825 [Vibrio parahaemolyticus]|uniref:hypothetical protein n=1 Tax=Vibrio parahaemolyticus TaxID=670 RepID=UPI00111EB2B4|nr:hypothetical protein [Vibrio parahaemolyticus]EKN4583347.1 hypothetical protein [Vibrio parahaemolyticus]TOM04034.1 hypothetical protein CGH86_09825 [Vibrio parahaemolyticus]HCE2681281.1 hypothetical protein [Vibrio parahaemolyticus]